MPVRNSKLRTVYFIVSEEQNIYIDRTRSIYPLTFFVVLRGPRASELSLYILAYLKDHKAFGFGVVALRKVKLIKNHCIEELIL